MARCSRYSPRALCTDAKPMPGRSAGRRGGRLRPVEEALKKRLGLPHFAQFDNDTCFQRARQLPDIVRGKWGRVHISASVARWLRLMRRPSSSRWTHRTLQCCFDLFFESVAAQGHPRFTAPRISSSAVCPRRVENNSRYACWRPAAVSPGASYSG